MSAKRGKERQRLYKVVKKAASIDRAKRKAAFDKKKAKRDAHYEPWRDS